MAYEFQDIDPENIDFKEQSDDARKKRLALAAAIMGGGGGGSFTDFLGQYATDRMAKASDNLTSPVQSIQDKLSGTQPQGPVGPVMPQEIAQQREQETSVQQGPVAQQLPNGGVKLTKQIVQQPEQVSQPAVPEQVQQQEQQPTQQVAKPVTPEEVQLPQPGPATQVAGPAQLSPGAIQQVAENAKQPALVPQQDLNSIHQDQIVAAHNEQDPTKRRTMYAQLLADKNVSEDNKKIINQQIADDYFKQKGISDAEQKIAKATPNDLARYMQERKEEGSYLKAILYHRLGLTELAQQEQEKISPTTKMESATSATGGKYTVVRNKAGEIINAFTSEGKTASPEEIANLSAAALPTKAHLLPSVHGSPVVNAQGEVGTLMMDPQSQSTYVLVGNQKRPTTGWTTMAQNVQNVYNQAQAGALGKGAGEGFAPTPMRPLPGGVPQAGGAGVAPATADINRVEGDIAGLQREIKSTPNTPQNQGRLQILNQELSKAQQQRQQLGGAIGGLPAGAGTQGVGGAGIAQQRANLAVQEAQQKEGIQVAGARSQAFNKILDEEIRPQAQNGDTIVNTRKQQFQIFDRPGVDASKIFGIANGAGQSPGDQRWTMLRDVLLGKTTATDDQIRERAAQLGLNREEQAALAEYNIANAKINAATLKQTAGAGSVSDAEQRANREMNVDPTKVPALGAYNAMAQSQFNGDLARYKADWAESHPATNALQLDKAWRKESQQLTQMYADTAKERIKFITANGSTAAAVKEAYKRYPIPEYDPQTESWKKTKPLSSFER